MEQKRDEKAVGQDLMEQYSHIYTLCLCLALPYLRVTDTCWSVCISVYRSTCLLSIDTLHVPSLPLFFFAPSSYARADLARGDVQPEEKSMPASFFLFLR